MTLIKSFLDPHYLKKDITKDHYKEIVAKCVTKVFGPENAPTAEVDKSKVKLLVEGYVTVYKHRAKRTVVNKP